MTATFCLAAIAQRLARPANTLALAALGDPGVQSLYLFDVGCQLSFLAIGALDLAGAAGLHSARQAFADDPDRLFGPAQPLDDLERQFESMVAHGLRRAGASVIDGVVASTVVWLAALPLVALRFHLVSPIGILLEHSPDPDHLRGTVARRALRLVLSAVWGPLGWPARLGRRGGC